MASYLSKQGGDEKPTPSSTETGQRDYSQHARALMATNQIAAHISLVTMGIVPSIESHEVSTAIRDYAKFDEDEMLAGTSLPLHADPFESPPPPPRSPFCSHFATNSIGKHTNAATRHDAFACGWIACPYYCAQNSEPSRSTRNHRKTPRTPRERRPRCPKSRTPR